MALSSLNDPAKIGKGSDAGNTRGGVFPQLVLTNIVTLSAYRERGGVYVVVLMGNAKI